MTARRWRHVSALAVALGAAVAPAWIDPAQTWTGRIAMTVVTGLLLAVKTDDLRTYRNLILGVAALGATVLAAVAGKFSGGTAGAAIVGGAAAAFAQIRVMLAAKLAALPAESTSQEKGQVQP